MAKRYFSETALDTAQDHAESQTVNMSSSEYLHLSIETLLEKKS
jgi:hypothetical protein